MSKGRFAVAAVSAALIAAACAGSSDEPAPTVDATASLTGEQIWAKHCATCHGDAGQGAEGPSVRDWSTGKAALVASIAGRMPRNDPSLCRGDCPSKVADYVLSAFTSAAACDAGKPPVRRVRLLSRRELRATLADLLFPASPSAAECGVVTFRYEPAGTPTKVHVAGSFNAWAGTIAGGGLAMTQEPGTKAWSVKKKLVPGTYPYKFVVDESKWEKDPTNKATAPDGFGGENSVVTVACGDSANLPFDPAASLPLDTRPEGYPFDVHGGARIITADSMDAYFSSAWAVAAVVRQGSAAKLLGCSPLEKACLDGWVKSFGQRAFRRPLTDAEVARYAALATGVDVEAGVEAIVATFLSSPHFLYRVEAGDPVTSGFRLTPWETASALSYFLWGTMPDTELFDAAAAGELGKRTGIEKQARRMLASPRAREQIATIVAQWLGTEQVVSVEKSSAAYPAFSPELRRDLLDETRAFAAHVVFEGSHRVDELFTANYTFANARTAAHYGITGVTGDALVKTMYPDSTRAGILGHASVLATTSHSDQSSPIRRGLFVRRNLLCETFGVPPPNAGGVPKVDPAATTRERFAQHTANTACAGCHKFIDPVGFGFERFDGVGTYRTTENGKPIDATGDMLDVEGQGKGTHAKFGSLAELGKTLGTSQAAKACFVKQVRRFAHGSLEQATDLCSVQKATEALDLAKGDVRELIVHLVTADDFVPSEGAMRIDRRSLLGAALAGALGTTLAASLGRRAHAASGKVKRLLVFNFPDGVPNPAGGPQPWWPTSPGGALTLAPAMTPLEPHKKQLLFFRGLSMGGTDEGSHPGGAKKLLTGVDGGGGVSIDRHLASTVGKSAPYPHLYLGAQAAANNASGDKFISYPAPGTTAAPIDDPFAAYKMLFGAGLPAGPGGAGGMGGSAGAPAADLRKKSAVSVLLTDLGELQGRLGAAEKARLDLHRDALEQLDKRLTQLATPPMMGAGGGSGSACAAPMLKLAAQDAAGLAKPETFPAISRAQIDVMVAAMACGLTRVGVLQLSQHTSELVMSRFEGTELYTPNFDMRSHQASHYGDPSDPKFTSYVAERRWFMGELAYLLQRLSSLPEDGATMLDHTLVLVCTEVCDGNTHLHHDMPFFVAGGGAGGVSTGKIIELGDRRHGDFLATVAQALGDDVASFGVGSSGPIAGVLL